VIIKEARKRDLCTYLFEFALEVENKSVQEKLGLFIDGLGNKRAPLGRVIGHPSSCPFRQAA